jgi:hypothetical protein
MKTLYIYSDLANGFALDIELNALETLMKKSPIISGSRFDRRRCIVRNSEPSVCYVKDSDVHFVW